MQTIKCFWAGRLIVIPELNNDLPIAERLEEIQKCLNQKQIKLSANGIEFQITELCVDVVEGSELVVIHNLKAC